MNSGVYYSSTRRNHWRASLVWNIYDMDCHFNYPALDEFDSIIYSNVFETRCKPLNSKICWQILFGYTKQLLDGSNGSMFVNLLLNSTAGSSPPLSSVTCQYEIEVGEPAKLPFLVKNMRMSFVPGGLGKPFYINVRDFFELRSRLFPGNVLGIVIKLTVLSDRDHSSSARIHSPHSSLCNFDCWHVKLYKNPNFSDVKILCGDVTFPAHKIVLASQSQVFEKMLESPMKEAKTNEIKFDNFPVDTVEMMLKYLYQVTVDMPIRPNGILDLLNVAEMYDLKRLKIACLDFMISSMSDENVGEYNVMAHRYNASEKYKSVFRQYCQESHKILIQKPAYLKLFKENLDMFI
ncbi:unnamed protein product [Allacma fusca]|uniref:BTB domain-containing protein n=1 Tax=Allacma fusca TaxID=39272 RepID=A0A8J2JY50_9HEXA|nr:unnamed protein product [Allacma fusca]